MGRKQTEETRRKISEAAKERYKKNPEHIKNISKMGTEAKTKQGISEETRAKLSAASKARWDNPEYASRLKAKMSEVAKARWADPSSEAARIEASETMKNNWKNPEYREKHLEMSLASLEKAHETELTEETRKKLSESAKRQWQDEEFRSKAVKAISKTQKERFKTSKHPWIGRNHKEESKALMSGKAQERCQDEDWRKKKSEEQKAWLEENGNPFAGKKHTEHTKETISKKAKLRFEDVEWVKRWRKNHRPSLNTPEYKNKRSVIQKEKLKDPEFRRKQLTYFTKKKPTSLERVVAEILDSLGVKYETQKLISRAIADFYIPDKNLIIEADGKYWHDKPEVKSRDRRRDAWLRSKGYKVIRLSEAAIKEDCRTAVITALSNEEAD